MEHQKDGVITGQCAHDIGIAHVIQRKGRTLRHTLDGFQHHDVLGRLYADHALAEDGAQLVGKVQLRFLHRHGIAIAALPGRLLHQMKLLDIPGNGSLRRADAQVVQALQKLLLRLDGFLADDLQQLFLSHIFHFSQPPIL